MSKLLIFSDVHIHPHKRSVDRLQDCLNALEWVFKTAEEQSIDHILFLGDLFHNRQRIEILTYHRAFDIFKKYLNGKIKPWSKWHLFHVFSSFIHKFILYLLYDYLVMFR